MTTCFQDYISLLILFVVLKILKPILLKPDFYARPYSGRKDFVNDTIGNPTRDLPACSAGLNQLRSRVPLLG
jgi:hypothetical protein